MKSEQDPEIILNGCTPLLIQMSMLPLSSNIMTALQVLYLECTEQCKSPLFDYLTIFDSKMSGGRRPRVDCVVVIR